MKTYGLLEETSSGLKATDLARRTQERSIEVRHQALAEVCLSPAIFRDLHGRCVEAGAISRKQLSEFVLQAGVSEANAQRCIDRFVQALEAAHLVRIDGDTITVSKPPSSIGMPAEEVMPRDSTGDSQSVPGVNTRCVDPSPPYIRIDEPSGRVLYVVGESAMNRQFLDGFKSGLADRANSVSLAPDVAEAFPTEEAVNEALRLAIQMTKLRVG
jgi:hypothetical protein